MAKIDFNSQKFYRQRPDLAPRNVYLREGRVIKQKEVEKYFVKAFKEQIYVRIMNWFKNKIKK